MIVDPNPAVDYATGLRRMAGNRNFCAIGRHAVEACGRLRLGRLLGGRKQGIACLIEQILHRRAGWRRRFIYAQADGPGRARVAMRVFDILIGHVDELNRRIGNRGLSATRHEGKLGCAGSVGPGGRAVEEIRKNIVRSLLRRDRATRIPRQTAFELGISTCRHGEIKLSAAEKWGRRQLRQRRRPVGQHFDAGHADIAERTKFDDVIRKAAVTAGRQSANTCSDNIFCNRNRLGGKER